MTAEVISIWQWVVPVAVIALILYVACRAIIGTYFSAKENYVTKLFDKLKRSQ